MDKLVLIDGHSIMNRAFYGVPDLTNSEGLHTNAVYGFLNIMLKILEEEKADHAAVAFDLKEPTFRQSGVRPRASRYPWYRVTGTFCSWLMSTSRYGFPGPAGV